MNNQSLLCPTNGMQGKPVKLSTVKSMLTFEALAHVEPSQAFFFCPDSSCRTVYYSASQTFVTRDIRVKVFQKDTEEDVPVCYCFGWTRAMLNTQADNSAISAPTEIRNHIKANRCACDLRNPQGVCCLGNVENHIRSRQGDL